MKEITERQKKALDFIEEFTRENGYAPSFREIGAAIGVTIGAVQKLLRMLEKKSLIRREAGRSRVLRVTRKESRIPIYAAARGGTPRIVDEEPKEYFDARGTLGLRSGDRGIYVVGDSMVNAGIADGSVVFFRKVQDVKDNDIVIARVEEGVTVKRYGRQGKKIVLKPDNPLHDPIVVDPAVDSFEVIGKVVSVIKNYGKDSVPKEKKQK
jgi:repressor LexA